MPCRNHGRNVARYGANVRHFARTSDGKIDAVWGMATLLQKWCTFAECRTKFCLVRCNLCGFTPKPFEHGPRRRKVFLVAARH
jgi:hypothetical protein